MLDDGLKGFRIRNTSIISNPPPPPHPFNRPPKETVVRVARVEASPALDLAENILIKMPIGGPLVEASPEPRSC
jgi:hypothetical protein